MSDLATFWVGIRSDGIELDRIEVTATETGRSNGVVSYRVASPVLFVDLPADCINGSMSVHEDEYGAPFAVTPIYRTLSAGDSVQCDDLTFEKPINLPRHKRAEKRKRLRSAAALGLRWRGESITD